MLAAKRVCIRDLTPEPCPRAEEKEESESEQDDFADELCNFLAASAADDHVRGPRTLPSLSQGSADAREARLSSRTG